MNQEPNYELLREAYAIIGGIPGNKIALRSIVSMKGPSLDCGTIACAAGWLGMHPKFQALGLEVVKDGLNLSFQGEPGWAYYAPLARTFNIDVVLAHRLFCTRGNFDHSEYDNRADKQVWLDRVHAYLEVHGQLTSQLEAAKA